MEFVKFKRAVHAQFNQLAAGVDMLFLTNVDKDALWDCYLNSFPEEERQSHNCNNCKHYIRHYGRVVAIKDNKVVTMWENLQLDEPYATVARNLDALVKSKPVVDVFITRDYELGIDRNNAYIDSLQGPKVITWNHLYYHMPNQLVYTGTESVSAVMGTLRTTKEVFKRALEELTIDSIETVLDLIGQNALYRGEQFKNDLSVFLGHKRHYDSLPDEEKDNWCWANFNRVGCARIRNTAIGTLLVNISSGLELDDCVTAYERIMAPENYQRPKSIVTKRMIEEAQKKVQELGLMDSLPRRHAALEDITVNNVIFANRDTNKFHKVNVMMLSPNYWDEQGIGNKHYFFMLDDCKNPEPVRGFFNEYLNSELTPHRKVFEVLADKMKTPYQEHQLSGLGFSSTMRNSVIVKVDGTFSRTLKVNF